MTEATLGAGGNVRVASKDVLIEPLPIEGETRLFRALVRLAKEQRGPGGRLGVVAPAVRNLLAGGDREIAELAVREAVRADIADEPPSFEYVTRRTASTPEGVALELYHRTRQTHPERTLEEYRALVTDANAEDVYDAIRAVMDAGSGPKAEPSGTSSTC